jgi:hypothetical protein
MQVLEGANVPVDEAAEERKGGAGDLGKVGASLDRDDNPVCIGLWVSLRGMLQ